jgi:alpha-mannosidase
MACTRTVDPDPSDAPTLHCFDMEPDSVDCNGFTNPGNVPQIVKDQAADSVPIAIDELFFEKVLELIDRHPAMHQKVAAGKRSVQRFLPVGLVDDLTNKFLHQIFERDQPGGSSVLVDDNR